MKMSMKLVALAALAVSLAPVAGSAGAANKPAAPGVKAKAGAPQSNPQMNPLGLTPAQIKMLDAIRAKARAEAAVVQKGKGTDQEKRTKLIAIAKKADAQAGAVLTPAQKGKIKQFQASMQRMRANDQAVMKSLTPAQKQKITTLRNSYMKKFQDVRANNSLNEQQKQQKAQALFTQLDAQIKAVLTPQQRAMLQRK